MNAAEHYSHAELLLDMAGEDDLGSPMETYRLAKAQVHATLALAAEQRNANTWIKEISDQLDTVPRQPVPTLTALEELRQEALHSRDLNTRDKLRLILADLVAQNAESTS